ncbi:MAG: hypothetical protein A2Z18_10115 [Armatimonadetes bacterium RBG_16_58_9]|nr:MAG: hypothetical protein A2Z18_10115 [Armatimonadetes bacterium RBG_16_58_9]
MERIAATVSDTSDVQAFECLLPDDVICSRLAMRLAELAHMPLVGSDNFPLNYGLIAKGGGLLEPKSTLGDVRTSRGIWMRLVPEIVVTNGEEDACLGVEAAGGEPHEDFDIRISEPMALLHDADVSANPDVRISSRVHRSIERFAEEDRHTECVGLLLGNVSAERGKRVIYISAAIPATSALGSRSSVKITFEAWEEMLRIRDADYPDLRLLGWFHSHAGWGVFMSDPDVFFHRHFFPNPNMVAYVLDPTSARDGFFYWHEGKIGLCPSYGLVGAPEEVGTRRPRTGKRRGHPDARDAIIAGLIVLSLYLGFSRPQPHAQVEKATNATNAKVSRSTPKISVAPEDVQDKDRVYAIARGDSPWTICRRVYGDAELAQALIEYNRMRDHTRLQLGQQIKLPPKEVLDGIANER